MYTLNHNNTKIGSFSGYASVFNVKDSYNDCILPKAFSKSLFYSNKLEVLWEHDPKKVIGIAKVIEDKHGLYVEGNIFLDAPYAKNAYNFINQNQLNHMSIGYKTNSYYKKNGVRYIKEIDLKEISLVINPANRGAKIYRFNTR